MLIFTKYIAKHEFKPLQKYFTIEDVIEGGRKVIKGLGQKISAHNKSAKFRFFKVRIGGTLKGRMIVFLVSENKKVVPLLIRLKKDKKLGMNMSASNPNVIAQIDKNLEHVLADIAKGKAEEFEL